MMADFMLYIFYHIFMGLNKIKASEVEKRKFPSFLTALQRKYETLPKIYKSQSTVAPGYLSDLTPVPPYSPFPAYCIHSHGGLAFFPQAGHLISKTPNQPEHCSCSSGGWFLLTLQITSSERLSLPILSR